MDYWRTYWFQRRIAEIVISYWISIQSSRLNHAVETALTYNLQQLMI